MSKSSESPEYACTEVEEIPQLVEDLRRNFYASTPTSYEYRIDQLKQLLKLIDDNKDDFIASMKKYYGGLDGQHYISRFFLIKYEILQHIAELHKYMKSSNLPIPFPISMIWSGKLRSHPRGVCGIISPWNYPIQLCLRPLAGAIAAGNSVVIKPSEITDDVAKLLADLIPKYLDHDMVRVVCGGPKETTTLLQQDLDFVLFTGGTKIGKIVMRQCAETLTPLALELGGKNPVIVEDDADIATSMKRIAYGRWFYNCGQVCVSPEYIFCSQSKQQEIVDALREAVKSIFGTQKSMRNDPYYNRIVSDNHWRRLNAIRQYYLSEEEQRAKIALPRPESKEDAWIEEGDRESRYMPPMIIQNVDFMSDKVMEDEVFGPFLSIVPLSGTSDTWKDEAISLIRKGGKPLVCYVFSKNQKFIEYFDERVAAGHVVANETSEFMILKDLPFGGIGTSGIGSYGGKNTFELFSQEKPLAVRKHGLESLQKSRYPPQDGTIKDYKKTIKDLEGFYPKESNSTLKWTLFAVAAAAVTIGVYLKRKGKLQLKRG